VRSPTFRWNVDLQTFEILGVDLYRNCVVRWVAQSVKSNRLPEHAPILGWNISDQDEDGDTLFRWDMSMLFDGIREECNHLLFCLSVQSAFDYVYLEADDLCSSRLSAVIDPPGCEFFCIDPDIASYVGGSRGEIKELASIYQHARLQWFVI
jgi:hypothetical protein